MNSVSKKYHRNLGDYFTSKSLYPNNSIKERANTRKLRELPYHLVKAGEWQQCYDVFTDIFFLEANTECGFLFDLLQDFHHAIEIIPENHAEYHLLPRVRNAIRLDAHFITRYPQLLFQCLYNRCWWYDHPSASAFFQLQPDTIDTAPWNKSGPKLFELAERWLTSRRDKRGDLFWIRILRPPDDSLEQPNHTVFRVHAGAVWTVAVSPNGQQMLSGGFDGTIRILEVNTGQELFSKQAHTMPVTMVQYSYDGLLVASGSKDKNLSFWRADNLELLSSIHLKDNEVWALAFSHDGEFIACGTDKGTVYVYKVNNKELYLTLTEAKVDYGNTVNTLAFSPDGKLLLGGIGTGNTKSRTGQSGVWLWDLYSNPVKGQRLYRHEEENYCVTAMTSDGKGFAVGNLLMQIGKLDPTPALNTIPGNSSWIRSVACSRDGRLIAFGGDETFIFIWDTQTKTLQSKLMGHNKPVEGLVFFPDSSKLVSNSEDGTLRVWDLGHLQIAITPTPIKIPVKPKLFVFSPTENKGAIAQDNKIFITDVSFSIIYKTLHHDNNISCFCWTPEGLHIVSATTDGSIYIWDPTLAQPIQSIQSTFNFKDIAATNQGIEIVAGLSDGKVIIWDKEFGERQLSLPAGSPKMSVLCVTVSPDGLRAAAGTFDGAIHAWDVSTGKELYYYNSEYVERLGFVAWGSFYVTALAFSPDAKQLVVLWSSNAKEITTLVLILDISKYNSKPRLLYNAIGDVKAIAARNSKFRWLALGYTAQTVILDWLLNNKIVSLFPCKIEYIVTSSDGRVWANLTGSEFSVFQLEGLHADKSLSIPKEVSTILDHTNKHRSSMAAAEFHKPANNPQQIQYTCSFCLLLNDNPIARWNRIIDSISKFLSESHVASLRKSEIICITDLTEESVTQPSNLKVIGPKDLWEIEKEPHFGPQIVRQFHTATKRAIGEFIIMLAPGAEIRNTAVLDEAIKAVALNRRILAVSHNFRTKPLPDSAVFASSVSGTTTGADSWYGVKARKKLFGGISYKYCHIEMATDVAWLIAAIAAEFERDKSRMGHRPQLFDWT